MGAALHVRVDPLPTTRELSITASDGDVVVIVLRDRGRYLTAFQRTAVHRRMQVACGQTRVQLSQTMSQIPA